VIAVLSGIYTLTISQKNKQFRAIWSLLTTYRKSLLWFLMGNSEVNEHSWRRAIRVLRTSACQP